MATFDIKVDSKEVQEKLAKLIDRTQHPKKFLEGLGDDIIERTERRFVISTGPDGVAWKPNSPATLRAFAHGLAKMGSYRTKSGALNAKGQQRLSSKKPLIVRGELNRQFDRSVISDALAVKANTAYASPNQFGAKTGRGNKVTLEARPFMPIKPDGTLYPQEEHLIIQALNDYLMDGL